MLEGAGGFSTSFSCQFITLNATFVVLIRTMLEPQNSEAANKLPPVLSNMEETPFHYASANPMPLFAKPLVWPRCVLEKIGFQVKFNGNIDGKKGVETGLK